jgi:hypothetical protein
MDNYLTNEILSFIDSPLIRGDDRLRATVDIGKWYSKLRELFIMASVQDNELKDELLKLLKIVMPPTISEKWPLLEMETERQLINLSIKQLDCISNISAM